MAVEWCAASGGATIKHVNTAATTAHLNRIRFLLVVVQAFTPAHDGRT